MKDPKNIQGYIRGDTLLQIFTSNFMFLQVMRDPTKRRRLVDSIHSFLKRWGFDGFDFDWEYPARRGGIASDAVSVILAVSVC